jgi:hypothetical protein
MFDIYKTEIQFLLSSKLKVYLYLMPNKSYMGVVRHTRKANRTNSTFGFFCRHAKPTLKKPKELFFCQRSTEN